MRRDVIICVGLAAITLALFWPLSRLEFINLDDPDYVTENAVVQAGITWAGVQWAFSGSHASNWHPLTWLSHMLDCQLFGLKAGAHHLVNLGFHIASTLLLFLTLGRMTDALWRSALVAALFGWHPLHVESVAWVAERKDVLSAFFFMLTLWAYGRFAECRMQNAECRNLQRRDGTTHHAPRTTYYAPLHYALALTFFALGLMSKPMLVTVPFILLLLDYWPLQRFQPAKALNPQPSTSNRLSSLVLEKWPFFVFAAGSGAITVWAQYTGGAVESLERLPLGRRLANALCSYAAYLGKAVWPENLAVFYPHVQLPAWKVVLSVLLLACLTALCIRKARSHPWLLVGWLWFGLMLLPVIGLVQVGWQAMADRYTYLPSVGLFTIMVWGAAELGTRWPTLRPGWALVLLGVCLATSRQQVARWENSVTLFRHALAVTTGNWFAHNNLGTALARQGQVDEGAAHFRVALQLNPGYDDALSNHARYLAERGKPDEAAGQLSALVERNPQHFRAQRNLGRALMLQGNLAEAVTHYASAQRLRPDDPVTAEDLAGGLTRLPESQAALPYLKEALDLLPSADLRAQVASAWAAAGKFQFAVLAYRAALTLQPESPGILNNLAWVLATCSRADLRDGGEAVRLARKACELTRFQRTVMLGTLAAAYAEAGQFSEAVSTAQQACALATASGDRALLARNEELLQSYRAGRAYREPGAPPGGTPSHP